MTFISVFDAIPDCLKSLGLAGCLAENCPIHIRAKLFALDAGQGFDVGATVGGDALLGPLINDHVATQPEVFCHFCDPACRLYRASNRGF